MSDWTVHLEFEEGNSSKFWRARVEGKTLYVNYGKIGSNGQTQVKDFPSPDTAQNEYEKLVREKRKKGYVDAGGGGGGGEDEDEDRDEDEGDEDEGEEEEAPAPKPEPVRRSGSGGPASGFAAPAPKPAAPAPAARPQGERMVLESGSRKVETYVSLDGSKVRMESIETYASPEAAKKAQERLKRMLAGEGYKIG